MHRIMKYRKVKKCMKYIEQQNQLPSMEKEFVWLKEIDSISLQMALRNLDTAFKNFFEDRADRAKFRSKRDSYKSYTSNFVNNNVCYEICEAGKVLGYTKNFSCFNVSKWRESFAEFIKKYA